MPGTTYLQPSLSPPFPSFPLMLAKWSVAFGSVWMEAQATGIGMCHFLFVAHSASFSQNCQVAWHWMTRLARHQDCFDLPNKTGVARRRFNPPIYSPRGPLFFLPPSHVKPAVSRCTFANKQSLSRAIFTSQILLSRLIHNTMRWTLRTPNFIYSEWPHNESLRDC